MYKLFERSAPKTVLLLLFLGDIISINLSSLLALWVRFDMAFSRIPREYLEGAYSYALINTAVTLLIFVFFRLYVSLWTYASMQELVNIFFACCAAFALQYFGTRLLHIYMPRSYYVLSIFALAMLTVALRFSYRFARTLSKKNSSRQKLGGEERPRVLLVGAGDAGAVILKELQNSRHLNNEVCCIVDDDLAKKGKYIYGVKVEGGRLDIPALVCKYNVNRIIVAMPSANPTEIRKILEICKNTGCELRILPGIYQLVDGNLSVTKLRKVEIEDLLGRDPIQVNLDGVLDYVRGKVVMVTGGGGSIGSELCRQLAGHGVKQLIIFDMYENNAYAIQQELKDRYPDLDLKVLIGSVRNSNRVDSVFCMYRPDIVYHAAAHKHVPLMEDSPNEAIKNNVIGTYKAASAAVKYGTKRFLLISTDKAVNPTNIMGASKRLCEMVIQTMNQESDTEFVAVRFGNVLGSNGSVVPLFKKQIEKGGPVTVTHPDIIRFFMTIPEAVSLVIQAGAYAKGGEIFVLDMGEPVKILDLAQNMIRLSGYEPERDIPIVFTGLRPGEKLYEELLMDEEGMRKTDNDRIFIGKPLDLDPEKFRQILARLDEAAWKECDNIRELVQEAVPEYHYEKEKA